MSKRVDRPYLPGDRGVWVKSKCLNRAEFVVVGWSDPEGSRPLIGALLLGYYEPGGRLIYAGRVGTGMSVKTLALLHQRLAPLATSRMPLSSPPPKKTRFGGPLALSRVHWVHPELVAEITFLGWTDEPLRAIPSSSDCVRTSRQAKSGGSRQRDRDRLPGRSSLTANEREENGMPMIEGFDKLASVPEEQITDKIVRRVVSRKAGNAGALENKAATPPLTTIRMSSSFG